MVDRKNFSFYMPSDFVEKMIKLQELDDRIKPLSRSQALYFIISRLAESDDGRSTNDKK